MLNIPIHYLKEVKDDKRQFELFAVAVLLKMKSVNSIIGKMSNKTIRQMIHCKHNVAERILEGFQDSPFFRVNQKTGVVFVPTFKSSVVRTFGKGRKCYRGTDDNCKKLEIKDYTLREIKKALRELLLENMVKVRQTKQVSHMVDPSCVTDATGISTTLGQFAAGFGLKRSSAWLYIDRMVKDGRVGKTQIVAECVIPELNDETAREWMERNPGKSFHAWHNLRSGGWSGWSNHGYIYKITDRSVSESFRHIIWNHKRRRSACISFGVDTPDGEGFWAKHS